MRVHLIAKVSCFISTLFARLLLSNSFKIKLKVVTVTEANRSTKQYK